MCFSLSFLRGATECVAKVTYNYFSSTVQQILITTIEHHPCRTTSAAENKTEFHFRTHWKLSWGKSTCMFEKKAPCNKLNRTQTRQNDWLLQSAASAIIYVQRPGPAPHHTKGQRGFSASHKEGYQWNACKLAGCQPNVATASSRNGAGCIARKANTQYITAADAGIP